MELTAKEMKLLKDYQKVGNHINGKKLISSEDLNEILLSSKYYPEYGEYGANNFLNFYKDTVKKLILKRELDKQLETNFIPKRLFKI